MISKVFILFLLNFICAEVLPTNEVPTIEKATCVGVNEFDTTQCKRCEGRNPKEIWPCSDHNLCSCTDYEDIQFYNCVPITSDTKQCEICQFTAVLRKDYMIWRCITNCSCSPDETEYGDIIMNV